MDIKIDKKIWDLKPLFNDDNDPAMESGRKEIEQKTLSFVAKWERNRTYLADANALLEALNDYELWQKTVSTAGAEGFYFWLRSAQDENNVGIKAKLSKIEEFSKQMQSKINFFELSLSRITEDFQKLALSDVKLKGYKHFLEKKFAESKYLLSDEAENILIFKQTPAHSRWVDMVTGFLSKEETEVLVDEEKKENKTFTELVSLVDDQNKNVRASAAEALNKMFNKHSDAAEAEFNAILENKKVDDFLRKTPRPDFTRHLNDDVDSSMVDTLVETVSGGFGISKRFYEFKAKLLKKNSLEYYERNIAIGSFDVDYSFQQAVELVHKVLARVDGQFGEIFKSFVEHGQMDVFPRKNKSSGAFCIYNLLGQPTYILLNYNGKLRDVTTLAHETGHGINDELMKAKQNSLNFGTPMATAEVASTFMEDFVFQELMLGLEDEQKLSLIVQKLNDEVSTIFRQIACYKFEQELHADYRTKGYLSKEDIGALFIKHMKSYMGDSVSFGPGTENWWIYWGHIRSFFYVYSYASGLLISKAMQNKLRQDPAFIGQVKNFLSAGLSGSPDSLFLEMGINSKDKEFWQQGLEEIDKLLSEAEALAKKLGKI